MYFWNKQKENIIWFSFVADYNYFLFFLFGYSILFACLRMKKRKYQTVLWNLKKNVRKRLKRTRVEKKKSKFFVFIHQSTDIRMSSKNEKKEKKKKKIMLKERMCAWEVLLSNSSAFFLSFCFLQMTDDNKEDTSTPSSNPYFGRSGC